MSALASPSSSAGSCPLQWFYTQRCPFPLNSTVSPLSLKLEAGAELTVGILDSWEELSSPILLKYSALASVFVPQGGSPVGQITRIHYKSGHNVISPHKIKSLVYLAQRVFSQNLKLMRPQRQSSLSPSFYT